MGNRKNMQLLRIVMSAWGSLETQIQGGAEREEASTGESRRFCPPKLAQHTEIYLDSFILAVLHRLHRHFIVTNTLNALLLHHVAT